MGVILKTKLLEYEKSTFLIDLVEYNGRNQYVRIIQKIHGEQFEHKQEIKINPSVLSDIIKTLNDYHALTSINIPQNKIQEQSKRLAEPEKKSVQERYLKGGVSVSDLAIQFDCTEELIKQILNNNGIEIVSQPICFKNYKQKYRKRYR
ncbi:MAG: hypothetical protein LBS94_02570 [Prevotellaceae bacterium]|jgi:hypothetical protein|nr:hypothetical protein [Prevotellaceae bacterium]